MNYSLSLINADRQSFGLQNVTISSEQSGQQHAYDMLKNQYFSHWDMQGYKPYMRYTLAGGKGAVAENLAAQLGSYSSIKQALKDLEWQMMNNDSASEWGHKENILNPSHNKVSIGIAYDKNNVYLVQDFEDDYIEWTMLNVSKTEVQMNGKITNASLSLEQISIYFDSNKNLTVQQLSNPPYQDAYDSGTYVGAIVPPDWISTQGTTIEAQTWNQTGQNFELRFDLNTAFFQYGKGVYTLYLWTSAHSYLTTYSIWNTGY